jgi:ferredoxin-NADP reductase
MVGVLEHLAEQGSERRIAVLVSARAQLLAAGVPTADIHYEVFGPDLGL